MPDDPLVFVFLASVFLLFVGGIIAALVWIHNAIVSILPAPATNDAGIDAPLASIVPADATILPALATNDAAIVPAPGGMPASEWLSMLNDHPDKYPVLFLYGPQGTGKTTMLRCILNHRGGRVVLFAVKPDDAWEFPHHTIDDDGTFTSAKSAMVAILQHTKQRIADHKKGIIHDPITVVVDDALALRMHTEDEYDPMVKFIATVGRSYRVRLIVVMHSDRGVVAGFKGQTDMLDGFLKMSLFTDEDTEQRSAALRRTVNGRDVVYDLDTTGVYERARKPLGDMAFERVRTPPVRTAHGRGALSVQADTSGGGIVRICGLDIRWIGGILVSDGGTEHPRETKGASTMTTETTTMTLAEALAEEARLYDIWWETPTKENKRAWWSAVLHRAQIKEKEAMATPPPAPARAHNEYRCLSCGTTRTHPHGECPSCGGDDSIIV